MRYLSSRGTVSLGKSLFFGTVLLGVAIQGARAEEEGSATEQQVLETTTDSVGEFVESEPLPPVQPPVIQIDEVSVTAARAVREVLDQPGNITVLTREDILEAGVDTVPELLRRQVGVFVTNTNGSNPTGFNIELRGFNNGGGNGSRTLVLIDGRRANLPQSGSADWALMNVDDVDRIEIVRGPASAVYGDNAVGGVIEIFTRRAGKPLQVELTTRGGSYGLRQGSLFAGGSVKDFSGSVFLDGYTEQGYREQSAFRSRNAKGNIRYTLGDRFIFDVEGGYTSDQRNYPGALTQAQIDALGRRAANPGSRPDFYNVENRFVSGVMQGTVVEGVELKLQPFWRRWSQDSGVGDSWGGFYSQSTNTSSVGVNGLVDVGRKLGPFGNRLVVGADWLYETDRRHTSYVSGGATSPGNSSNRRYIVSGYLQEEIQLLEGLLVSGGVRYDYARYHETNWVGGSSERESFSRWNPKAAVTYRVVEPLSVYFSYAKGLRFPNFDEIYPVFGSTATVLQPERSTSYEIGSKYRNAQVQAGLALYWMDVENEILYDPAAGAFGFGQNENIDEVRHLGVEASVSYRPAQWVELYANYTYDNSEIRKYKKNPRVVGKQLPITPENRGTVGFNLFFPVIPFDRAELGVNANIVGSRYVANDLENRARQLPVYGTVDLHGRLGKKFWDWLDVTLFFQVRNLNDEEYSQFAGLNGLGEVGFYPSPGTNFDVGLSFALEH